MKITCEYCGGFLQDTDESCPNCGATNRNVMRSADGIPKTIEQLKAFAEEKKLPLEKMRFFLGVDMQEPRAFGIYKDDEENFVVYKNKSNGERIVRYRGKDEAYAVNELYQKMRTEVVEQKAHQAVNAVHGHSSNVQKSQSTSNLRPNPNYMSSDNNDQQRMSDISSRRRRTTRKSASRTVFIILFIIIIFLLMCSRNTGVGRLFLTMWGMYEGDYYESDYDYGNSYDSGYDYDTGYDYDDDYDSWADDWDDDDWDYDSYDSWDSGYTDWDSDW